MNPSTPAYFEIIKTMFFIFAFFSVCVWLWKELHKDVEWFSQHIIPENPREGRNISEDVLVYDYDNDCNLVAYYLYAPAGGYWKFITEGNPPSNFKWRYFDIDIDEP